jgi:hypothetical protein
MMMSKGFLKFYIYLGSVLIILALLAIVHEGSHALGAAIDGHKSKINWNLIYNANTTLVDEDNSHSANGVLFHTMPYFINLPLILILWLLLKTRGRYFAACALFMIALMAAIEVFSLFGLFSCNDICKMMIRTNWSLLGWGVAIVIFLTNVVIPLILLYPVTLQIIENTKKFYSQLKKS